MIKEQDFEEPRAKGEINSSYWKNTRGRCERNYCVEIMEWERKWPVP